MRPLIVVLGVTALCAGMEAAEPVYDGKTVSEWTGQLEASDPDLRRAAVRALRNRGPNAKAAVPALIKALKHDDDETVRFCAARALGEIGAEAKATLPYLIEALKDDREYVRGYAARALAKIGAGWRTAVPALIGMFRDDSWFVRHKAAEAIGEMGPEAVPAPLGPHLGAMRS